MSVHVIDLGRTFPRDIREDKPVAQTCEKCGAPLRSNNANTAGRNMKPEKTGGNMKILKLHSPEGNEVYVNIEKVYVVEQFKYGDAKLTRLRMRDYCQSVLEKPKEIFNETPVPASVIYTRSVIFRKEFERGNGKTCDT